MGDTYFGMLVGWLVCLSVGSIIAKKKDIFSKCVYTSVINHPRLFGKNPGHSHNSVYNMSKIDLNPRKNLHTMTQKSKK